MNFDERIAQLQAEKAAAVKAAADAKTRQGRRAFWLGDVAPVLGFLCLIAFLLMLFGR